MHQTLLAIRKGQQQSVHTERLPDGAAGNLRTLVFVRKWIREDAAFNLRVRKLAQTLIADCGPANFDCEVGQLFDYAQTIRFVRDPVDVERIADADTTIDEQQGDCVDKSIVLASLLGSVGHLTRGKVVNFAGDVHVRGFDHFYLEVQRPDGSWQPLDPTPENVLPGWEASGAVSRTVDIWDGTGGSNLSGLLDQILPGLIQQGFQLGTQYAANTQRQSQANSANSRQIGQGFDGLAGQVTQLFDQIQRQPAISSADLNAALAAYEQLAAVAQQYAAVEYVTTQWNSSAYKPAYEARLQQMAARVAQPVVPQQPGQSGSNTVPPPAVAEVISGLTSNPMFWPGVLVVLALLVLPKISGD